MDIPSFLKHIADTIMSYATWPTIVYVGGISLLCTIALKGIQFRCFWQAWKATIFGPDIAAELPGEYPEKGEQVDMSPTQAFINTLSSNLGNGSIAGMATAVYAGGPGAAFWVVIAGFFLMAVRFAEVYLSTYYGMKLHKKSALGGPMLYLEYVAGRPYLSYVYGFFCLLFGLQIGNAMQTNSIRVSIATTWGLSTNIITVGLLAFVVYIVVGGAPRIVKMSDRIVPIKVIVFFVSSFIVLGYHYQALWGSLKLIIGSAFHPTAMLGAAMGITMQHVLRYGVFRSIMATESGLGTAAILFGFTGSKDPIHSGFLGMISTFISTLVCLIVALCIVASGVWDSGANSTALTIASYNTVFGEYGGWIVSFLSISFGMGVLVTYAYITQAAWFFLTGGRFKIGFIILYCLFAVLGSLSDIQLVWDMGEIVNVGMLFINLFGIVYLLPQMRKDVNAAMEKRA